MKEIFVAFSKYNFETNLIICNMLSKSVISDLSKKSNCFYPSIIDSILHVMKSDCKWFSRLSKVSTNNYLDIIPIETIHNITIESVETEVIRLDQLIEIRKNIDTQITNFISSIDEEQFKKKIEIPFGTELIIKELWQLLLQWFNHQTHHRGQISLQFELVGKENDYSTVLGKID